MTPDGRSALSGSDDCTLKLWDLATGQPRLTFTGHTGAVSAVAIFPDGRAALSGSTDGTLRLWDLTTGQPRPVFAEHEGPVYALAITPDGRHVLSASSDDTLRLWDTRTSQLRGTFTGLEGPLYAMAITPDGIMLAVSGSADGNLKIWDLRTGQLCRTIVGHEGSRYMHWRSHRTDAIFCPAHSTGPSISGTCGTDSFSPSLPATEATRIGSTRSHLRALPVTPDGRRVLSEFERQHSAALGPGQRSALRLLRWA